MKPWGCQAGWTGFFLASGGRWPSTPVGGVGRPVLLSSGFCLRPPSAVGDALDYPGSGPLGEASGPSHSSGPPRRPFVRPPSGDTGVSRAGTPSCGLTRLALGAFGRPRGPAVAEHGPEADQQPPGQGHDGRLLAGRAAAGEPGVGGPGPGVVAQAGPGA